MARGGSPLAPPARRGHGFWRFCARCLRGCSRITVVAVLLALMAGGLGLARLAQGPVALPLLAEIVERRVNLRLEDARLEVGRAVFGLGRGGAPSGLVFEDVRVRGPEGALLMAAPRLSARFDAGDLLIGRVRPLSLTLTLPRLAVLRAEDGRLRVGLGGGEGVAMTGGTGGAGADALAGVIDGFVGDGPLPTPLSEVESIRVRGADIVYRDAVTGRDWRSTGSDITLWRTPFGASAVMRAPLSADGGAHAPVMLRAERARGTGRTDLRLGLDGVDAAALSAQLPGQAGRALAEGRLTGEVRATLGPAGRMRDLSGRLSAEALVLRGLPGRLARHDAVTAEFAWEEAAGRLRISPLTVEGPGLTARLSGELMPRGADPMAPGAIDVDLSVRTLGLDAPALFPDALAFDTGRLAGRLHLAPLSAEIAAARLGAGEMRLAAAGSLRPGAEGWQADLHLAGRAVSVARLKTHWPFGAAPGARDWVSANLVSGMIPTLDGRLRLDAGAPALDLGFEFRDVVSRYLGPMPAIRGGRGEARLDLSRFRLALAEGQVSGADGAGPIDLAGSHLTITDLLGPAPPGDITVEAAGPTRGVLGLIDHAPLGLVSKLGLDPSQVAGQARVTAAIAFPMLDDLAIEEVEVAAEAALSDTRLALPLAGARRELAAERLDLAASTEAMTLTGRARLAGRAFDVTWREGYGAGPGTRRVRAEGRVGARFLEQLGVPAHWFTDGEAALALAATAEGGPMTVTLDADLAPAALALVPLAWEKAAGTPGRLSAELRVEQGGIVVPALSLETAGLEVAGNLRLGPSGGVRSGRIERFRLAGRADLSGEIRSGAQERLTVALSGPWLDLSGVLDDPPETGPPTGVPLQVTAQVERVRLTPAIELADAKARLARDPEGRVSLDLSGLAGASAPFTARYARAPDSPAEIALSAPDAGALLRGLGLFGGASGGRLRADATLGAGGEDRLEGRARIREVTVRGAGTFGSILEEGGVDEAAEAVRGGGLTFDSVVIPFSRREGSIRIEQAVARSPLLAVTLEGDIEERSKRLDLRGVISPAYAISGAIDEIPVLGRLLTGGEGEGILAMTFTVEGTSDAPRFSVNPLSLLTPGILRGVFSAGSGEPSQRFLDQLGPQR